MTLKYQARALVGALVLAVALPSFAACENEDDSKKTFDTLEAELQGVLSAQKETQAAITREYQDKAAQRGWTPERGSKLFDDMLASSTFKDFEKRKQPYFDDVMNVIHMGMQSNGADDVVQVCRAALKLGPSMQQVKDINAQEKAYLMEQVREAR